MQRHKSALGAAVLVTLVWNGVVAEVDAVGRASSVLERLGLRRGICVVLGDLDAALALEVARQSELLVYTQSPDHHRVDAARRRAETLGLDASRFQIDRGSRRRLHLGDNIANAVVVVDPPESVDEGELLRVARPDGKVILGERTLVKPFPAGMDDWSHPYHGPDNNPLSSDRLILAPYATQFLGDPRYAPAPQVAVAAGGRTFKAFGHVAWHEREEPFLNTLVSFDGFNGTLLWKRPLPEGYMIHRNTIVATAETLYIADSESCKRLTADAGSLLGEIRPPPDLVSGTFWKWMALEKGILYALVGEQEQKDPTMRWKRKEHGWPWNQISKGYTQGDQPWGFGRDLLALSPETGAVLWHHREKEAMDSRALCMKAGRIFVFRFGAYLACLDATTGKTVWRRTKENDPKLFETLGSNLPRQGWATNWRTTAYVKCSQKALYFAGPQVGKLLALSVEDGRVLWENPYDNFQLVIRDEAVFAISGPWGQNVSQKLHPMTGAVLATLPTGRRACTRPTATADSILFRAMGGSVRFDVATSRPRWISPMRPQCQDGVTIANGLLYWWPYTCDCQLTLYGVICLGSASRSGDTSGDGAGMALERPVNAPESVVATPPSPRDWPTFRADASRSATSESEVARQSKRLWTAHGSHLSQSRLTAPVSAQGLVFLADSTGSVRALDAATGESKWSAHTGGEVRFPPTIWRGRAYVGSGDGWVYCFEARSGRLNWRFRAAPRERKIPVYGRLLSTWPAASGVLVKDGVAYVAAGIVNYDGTFVYALDAETGSVRWRNDTSGHLDAVARTGVSVQGHLLLSDDKLFLAGGNAVSPAVYDIRDGRCLNDPEPLSLCESTSPRGWELFKVGDRVICCGRPLYARREDPVYDHTVTKKLFHSSRRGNDIVWVDQKRLSGYDPLPAEWLNRCVTDEKVPRHITQAWGRFRVPRDPRWRRDTPDGVALAVARNAVVVATRSTVQALDLVTGEELWTSDLPASPVPWGMALDRNGRVIICLENGQVLAIGEP